jgi:AcrR family transcriptional regulator
MGKLLRERSREEARNTTRERKRAILEAATHSFLRLPYAEVDLDAIGRRAGLAKGIVTLYFETREVLFLRILRDMLDPWFESVIQELAASDDSLAPSDVARLIAGVLLERDDLTRMMGLLPSALEQNVEVLTAMDFMAWLRDRTDQVGRALERRCPALQAGGGIRFLVRLQILVAGAPRMAHVSGMFAAAIHDVAPGINDDTRKEELERLVVAVLADLTRD